MRYEQFQQAVEDAGISLREFAGLLKLNPNSVTNYKQRRDVPSHLGVIALLILELVRHNIDYRPIIRRANVKAKAPRGSIRTAFGRNLGHRAASE
jgi:hypothetical protein